MNNSMITSSVSMGALQRKLDLLAENVSNVNTTGYKRKTAVFEDILNSIQPQHRDFLQEGRSTPLGFTQGWGMRMSALLPDMSQATLIHTGVMTDLAIEGKGLFEVAVPGQGGGTTPAYTRSGNFQLVALPSGDRQLVTNAGMPVVNQEGENIIVPAGHELIVGTDGSLRAFNELDYTTVELGRIRVVEVRMPELLQSIGDNLYVLEGVDNLENVVEVLEELPADTVIMQGYTEASNVSLVDELTELITVQRAYELNARALSSADQMLGMAVRLRT